MRRREFMRLTGALLLAEAAAARAQADGKTLHVGFNADIRSTDPAGNRDQNTDTVLLHCVEGLVAFRENTEIGPLLAERYEVSDDGRIYTFSLRGGVGFHNGAKLTAADVVWSWRRLLDPATQWRGLPEFDGHGAAKILSVAAKDDATVVFTLDQPSALFLVNMARPDFGGSAILHKDSVGADGKWIAPIGTGPFKLGRWQPGQSIELLRFDGYASLPGARDGYTGGKQAAVARVLISLIPDSAAAATALRGGAMDIIWPVDPAVYAELKAAPGIKTDIMPIMDMYAVLLQTQDPLLKDVRIRRALAMALDTSAVTEAASQGLFKANPSIVPATSPYYTDVQRQGIKQDVEAAKKLLADAGYNGQPIKLLSNTQQPVMNPVAVVVQALAAEIGLNLQIEVLDWATQLDRYLHGNYQAMSFAYSARLDPAQMFDAVMGPKATQPRKVWDDADAQALLTQSMRETGHDKRQALFDDLHRRAIDAVALIPLCNSSETTAFRDTVRGYHGWPADDPRFWGIELA